MSHNVLFYTECKVCSTKGGTERATISTASILKEFYHYKCYSIYSIDLKTPLENCFEKDFLVDYKKNPKKIADIIQKYEIDVVINQSEYRLFEFAKDYLPKEKTKYIFAHHFAPGWEEEVLTFQGLLKQFSNATGSQKVKDSVKLLSYPLYRARNSRKHKLAYRNTYEFSDKTVLLTNGFIKEYMKYADIKDDSKFAVIPNTLSFSTMPDPGCFNRKEKRVLIVTRMQDRQKRIVLALKIWGLIKKRKESYGWSLDIVGTGEDFDKCTNYSKKNNIPDVTFYGNQVPNSFYKRSSIFMMTSRSEGWGLTLTESQQFLVVPVVFDTVSVFNDIIQDEYNGYLVKEGNIDKYVDRVCTLMSNDSKRKEMAQNGYISCQRFSRENVGAMWKKLIDEVSGDTDD